MSQENSALLPSNYSELPREAKKTNDSTFDRIYKYFFNSKSRIELTQEETDISKRWERAYHLLCSRRTRKQVADLLMRQFGISKSLAYDDVKNAMALFGEPQGDKSAKRAIAEDAILKGMDKAWKQGDLKMYEKFTAQYVELNGLKNEDATSMADLVKKMKPHQVVIVSNMDQLKDDVAKLQEDLIQDIPHEEVNEGEAD